MRHISVTQTARAIPFDNTGTGLTATNIQDALLQILSTITVSVEEFTLTQNDITNGYVELNTLSAVNNSVNLFIGRLAFFQDVDYTLTSAPGTGKLRITFSGNLASDQPEAPSVGDYLRVTYWTI
jgi:hypothetical protein